MIHLKTKMKDMNLKKKFTMYIYKDCCCIQYKVDTVMYVKRNLYVNFMDISNLLRNHIIKLLQ